MRVGAASALLDDPQELQKAASSIFVPLRVGVPAEGRFEAGVDSARMGSVVVARITSTPAMVNRDARCVTSTDTELLKVTLHLSGSMIVIQDGRQCRVRPGDLVAYETSRPYRLIGTDVCDIVVAGVPRAMLGPSADLIGRRTAVALPGDRGVQAVIAAFLYGLGRDVDALSGLNGLRLSDALVSLIISAFTDTTPERADTGDLAGRLLAYAAANLSDPGLCAEKVARRHGISTRYLHKLLRDRGISFGAWVRRERLHRIRRDLTDPAFANRTIAAIAARWGMTEPGHLSRAFRGEFGRTPLEIRRTGS
ncbi:helix-turn-helix domain-containing protein [Actinoallomurus iriomotensis]|uniref:AraC family transcriptional regulator n=1 Tax=Actinoallomurus iriomotensis TaxID=478107 RepID=A0A9W6VZ96_9ACTN|nr:helix-turn-helix domain-containing protein [Actinoallomurus iriomotensis]GLY85670.1 AraC family transcriptional regulator [Actinoallomurus iriomotensis]